MFERALNTSELYRAGQAVGSAIGGFLYARALLHAAGYVVSAFVALALVSVIITRPKKAWSAMRVRMRTCREARR